MHGYVKLGFVSESLLKQQERQCNSNARIGETRTAFGVTPKRCKEPQTQTGNNFVKGKPPQVRLGCTDK
eukprot:2186382-Amphidinium_carterae.4